MPKWEWILFLLFLKKYLSQILKIIYLFNILGYGDILDSVNEIYKKYGTIPKDDNPMTEVMAWTGIQMNTITDKSNSHIADMLIQGTTMGIIEGRKLLNQNPNIDQEVRQVLDTFVKMQENNVEKLKTFL